MILSKSKALDGHTEYGRTDGMQGFVQPLCITTTKCNVCLVYCRLHADDVLYFDDTVGLLVFGGSELIPSFQGYVGQATLYRRKAIQAGQVRCSCTSARDILTGITCKWLHAVLHVLFIVTTLCYKHIVVVIIKLCYKKVFNIDFRCFY